MKRALKTLKRHPRPSASSPWNNQWFKWLAPGLFVKRWLLLSAGGVLLASLGLAIWTKLTPIYRLTRLIGRGLEWLTNLFPNYISGPLVLAIGLFLIIWGQHRTLGSITEVLMPEGDEELVDVLLAHRRLNRGPKIVAIGGGTGLSTLLRGLKHYSANITAIVTVADDGGSSGRLRRELGLPPGDMRNCLAALADEEKLLTELFQYRFQAGEGLTGHSFGNLFLSAMNEVTGTGTRDRNQFKSTRRARPSFACATLSDMCLWAELADGRRIEGESNITAAAGSILKIGCTPANPPALPRALQAIREADYIIIGPGSLYTSVIPNLLVPELVDAIAQRNVPRIYICNIMSQSGETQGYKVSDHIRAIDNACGRKLFDVVLVQRRLPSPNTERHYAQENSFPVEFDREVVARLGRRTILANVMEEDEEKGLVRHSSQHLARILLRWYTRTRGL